MTKHTPGPWTTREYASYGRGSEHIICIDSTPENYTVVTLRKEFRNSADFKAELLETKANANLIAAAPELLEALEEVIELAWRDHKSEAELVLLENTDKLISKAKGEN